MDELKEDPELDELIAWSFNRPPREPDSSEFHFGLLVMWAKDMSFYDLAKSTYSTKKFKEFSSSTEGMFCRIAHNYNHNKISRVINDLKILVDKQIDLSYIVNRCAYLVLNPVYYRVLFNETANYYYEVLNNETTT